MSIFYVSLCSLLFKLVIVFVSYVLTFLIAVRYKHAPLLSPYRDSIVSRLHLQFNIFLIHNYSTNRFII